MILLLQNTVDFVFLPHCSVRSQSVCTGGKEEEEPVCSRKIG